MFTIQEPTAQNLSVMSYRIIEHSIFDRPIQHRIVDHEGTLIAKVNGKGNVEACQKMIDALDKCDRMKSLLKNRLVEIMKQLPGGPGGMGFTIRTNIETKFDEVLSILKDQVRDAPIRCVSLYGGEAVQIIEVL